VHLEGANLERANLQKARLEGANLAEAHLAGAHLSGAKLWEAHVEGADLAGAVGLTQEQLNMAYGDDRTILPDGLTRPAVDTASAWIAG
jgi:uncharacterized protein YjbI with pentapeptide repeats